MSPEVHYWVAVCLALSTGFCCGLYGSNSARLSVGTKLLFLIVFAPAFLLMGVLVVVPMFLVGPSKDHGDRGDS